MGRPADVIFGARSTHRSRLDDGSGHGQQRAGHEQQLQGHLGCAPLLVSLAMLKEVLLVIDSPAFTSPADTRPHRAVSRFWWDRSRRTGSCWRSGPAPSADLRDPTSSRLPRVHASTITTDPTKHSRWYHASDHPGQPRGAQLAGSRRPPRSCFWSGGGLTLSLRSERS